MSLADVEAWLRICSLVIGITVGIATLYTLCKKQKSAISRKLDELDRYKCMRSECPYRHGGPALNHSEDKTTGS